MTNAEKRQCFYMREALKEAEKAYMLDEVPVGAVIVKDDMIIGRGYNRRETDRLATSHAEILAINEACKKVGSWRLDNCTIYVTLEPCPMCAGAIINARIPHLVFGAKEEKSGSCGSLVNLFELGYNHRPTVNAGIEAELCKNLLQKFFLKKR